uniref:Uncharacterized protein n=1 Tax=Oryza punctata TaxID=4537 RepID=A0A0E0MJJ0_ORYPU
MAELQEAMASDAKEREWRCVPGGCRGEREANEDALLALLPCDLHLGLALPQPSLPALSIPNANRAALAINYTIVLYKLFSQHSRNLLSKMIGNRTIFAIINPTLEKKSQRTEMIALTRSMIFPRPIYQFEARCQFVTKIK